MLSFRPLADTDFPILYEWLQRPHVKEWWDEGEDTLEKVVQNYGPESDEEDVERFILLWSLDTGEDVRPIGFFQWYFLPGGTAGIDLFIGEPDFLNQGIGTGAIRHFLALLIERYNPQRIVIDPDPRNTRAIRAYEKAGFRHYATIVTEEGVPAYMMEIRR